MSVKRENPQAPDAAGSLAARLTDGEVVAGLRLVTMPMAVTEVVTICGSRLGGDIFSPDTNRAVADLTSSMLDKGTRKRDKFAISERLESVGARMGFTSDDYRVSFSARCLKKDLPLVIELLAEQLREPAFHESDLASLQKRIIGGLKRQGEHTDYRARAKFSRLLYPREHPNYIPPLEEQIAEVEGIAPADLQEFHRVNYGLGGFYLVATGDVDRTILADHLRRHFEDWQQVDLTPPSLDGRRGHRGRPSAAEVVSMPDKTSVDLVQGLVVGIDREHPDYLPLSMGAYVLGGNFSARLMTAVRDEEGLTYGIGASIHGGAEGKDGFWAVHGTFSPELLEKGRQSIRAQLNKWAKKGITAKELALKKTTLMGGYKVGLATTAGIAMVILDILERGRDLTYLDEYVEEIDALTLDGINRAIETYIQPNSLVTVAAGSIDADWKPLAADQG